MVCTQLLGIVKCNGTCHTSDKELDKGHIKISEVSSKHDD